MRRFYVTRRLWLSMLLAGVLSAGSAAADQDETNYFEILGDAWAVAEAKVISNVAYREGLLLGFPTRLTDVVHARLGKPQTIFLLAERDSVDDEPLYPKSEAMFLPIRLLPQHAYWRDNLPATPKHEVFGGPRYLFLGDDIEPAKELTRQYVAATKLDMPERAVEQIRVVSSGLGSAVGVLREDAAKRLTSYPLLERDLASVAVKRLSEFLLADSADAGLRDDLIAHLGRTKVFKLRPTLERLARGGDNAAGAALDALAAMGVVKSIDELLELAESSNPSVREHAAQFLAKESAEARAFEAAKKLATEDGNASVRAAALGGFGWSESDQAIQLLADSVMEGQAGSRVAGLSLARIGSEGAIAALKEAAVSAKSDGQLAAVLALAGIRGSCQACAEFLAVQRDGHENLAIREVIAVTEISRNPAAPAKRSAN